MKVPCSRFKMYQESSFQVAALTELSDGDHIFTSHFFSKTRHEICFIEWLTKVNEREDLSEREKLTTAFFATF